MRSTPPALLAVALASVVLAACQKDSAGTGAQPASSTSPSSSGAAAGATPVVGASATIVASAAPKPSASAYPPFVPPPPPAPAKPIVAKEGEALVTKAECGAWADAYTKIMSGYFDEPTHASCGPRSELAEARKEMLPIFAEQARALRDDCEVQVGRRYDKADAACFVKAKSTADWRKCAPRTPFFADAIDAVPYACEKPNADAKLPDADPELLAVRTAPRPLRAADCEPITTTFVELVHARAAGELGRCLGAGAAQQLKSFDAVLASVRDDVAKQCKAGVGGLYGGRDRLCFELAKSSEGWAACGFSTPMFRGFGEIASKLEPSFQEACSGAAPKKK
jgi:hypothetical protein